MDGSANALATVVVTYAQLQRIAEEKKQNAARNRAFLGRLRRFAGRDEDANAGADLVDLELIAGFLDSLRDEKGFHNRTAALTQLREYATVSRFEDHSLKAVLAQAMAAVGCTRWAAGKVAFPEKRPATTYAWVTRFLHGGPATEQSRIGLVRLELHLGLAESTLTQFIRRSAGGAWKLPRLFDLRNPLYSFEPAVTARLALPDEILRELELYFEFKTRPAPTVEIPGSGLKRLKRRTKYTETNVRAGYIGAGIQLASRWHKYYSCLMVQNTARSIYTHAVTKRGLKDLNSIVFLANAALVEDYISSEVEKRGEYNTHHEYVVSFCASILNQSTGFIAQLPEIFLDAYRKDVDPEVTPASWLASIKRQLEEIRDIPRRLKPNTPANKRVHMTRQKKRKLQKILETERFYERFVFPTIRYLEENRLLPGAPEETRLSYELDLLILVCFAACPLRILNWANVEWGKNLVREDSGWRLIVPRQELKNRRWLEEDFDVDLPAWCTPHLDHYHREVHPFVRLRRPEAPDLVLLSLRVCPGSTGSFVTSVYTATCVRMVQLTKALWNVEVSPHDWRDIYATDYLHEQPEGALVVAMMLNDKVETILARYAKPNYRRMSRVAARYFDEAYGSGPRDAWLGASGSSGTESLTQPSSSSGKVGSRSGHSSPRATVPGRVKA